MHIFQSDTAVIKGETESSNRQFLQGDQKQASQKSGYKEEVYMQKETKTIFSPKHEEISKDKQISPAGVIETNFKTNQEAYRGNKKDDQKASVNKQEEIASSNLNSLDKVESKCAKQFLIVNRNISLSPTPKTLEVKTQTSFAQMTTVAENSINLGKVNVTNGKEDNYYPNTCTVSGQIYQDNRNIPKKNSKPQTELDKEIATLEKSYAEKIEKIGDKYKPEKKIDLSKKDVNINRPAVLGPSRFESGIRRPSPTFAPSRNESVYSSNQITSKVSTQPSTSESGFLLAKSQTTADILSPETRRKRFDSNFNAVPEPFKHSETSKYSKDYETKSSITHTSVSKSDDIVKTSSYQGRQLSRFESPVSSSYDPATFTTSSYSSKLSVSSLPSPASLASSISSSPYTPASSTYSSSTNSRAKSEGNNLLLSPSSQYKDFYHQIQSTKDKYKSDVEKAMNFDRTISKPPIIKEKFLRPDPSPSTLTRDYSFRRQERESTVMKALINDRSKRGKSDDIPKSSSFRY